MEETIPLESKTDSLNDTSNAVRSTKSGGRLLICGALRTWDEVSRLNYLNYLEDPAFKSKQNISKLRSFAYASRDRKASPSLHSICTVNKEIAINETLPRIVLSLMSENQLWGCFYIFPDLYGDEYSPTVRIHEPQEISGSDDGVLTKDMVAACLTYLRRTPILGDFVYIKLDLSEKHLLNIDALQHYKYLVYLDLSSNELNDLSVLSHLLYLQFLSVDFNRLATVLEYSTPQWFLTEVHYKYNSVKNIRDLAMFWSLTILDLSHNNIKCISGLQSLRYLRHLDLSFNHIQCLENLNHLRILWLDLSYNNISTFELGPETGLWTLLHLEYLNMNENKLSSLKMFSRCTRLRELHVRNNQFQSLLELAVYMRNLRRLAVLDMRSNPICAASGYSNVVFNTFPALINLNDVKVDPVYQRTCKMDTFPDVNTVASRRLLRMLYVEQLTRSRVPVTPPADTKEVSLVVLVGQEAVGKGSLARKLASECSSKIKLARLHTTAVFHMPEHYIRVSRQNFDDMLLAGEFLTYSEMNGESYGLSREEAFITDGKVRICSMDLIGALTLKFRGRRPYLILTACHDQEALTERQFQRKATRCKDYERRNSLLSRPSTLQVMVSGRIFINGILNELITNMPSDSKSVFEVGSQCSLILDSEVRQAMKNHVIDADLLSMLTVSSTDVSGKKGWRASQLDLGLYSLYKRAQISATEAEQGRPLDATVDEDRDSESMNDDEKQAQTENTQEKEDKADSTSWAQSRVKFSGRSYSQQEGNKSLWKGEEATKSSKSVTFNAPDVAGLNVESLTEEQKQDFETVPLSISAKLSTHADNATPEDADLWFAFLAQLGLISQSDSDHEDEDLIAHNESKNVKAESIITHLNSFNKVPPTAVSTNPRDDYEHIHRQHPGLFHDTIAMDDPREAYKKAKQIIRDIVNSQNKLGTMFDIAFEKNIHYYPNVEQRLEDIRHEIAPRQIFY